VTYEDNITATLRTAARTVADRTPDGVFSYQSWMTESTRLLVEAGHAEDEATELFMVYDHELTHDTHRGGPNRHADHEPEVVSVNGSTDADEPSLRLTTPA
jgi:hypothetical protein